MVLHEVFHHQKKRIYLDYAAATPVRSAVLAVMQPYDRDLFANPSAIHAQGVAARQAIDTAREKLARTLKIRPSGIIFTGSGTESNNLAILGTVQARHAAGGAYADMEVVATEIEHPSVSQVLVHLTTLGVQVRYVAVDTEGSVHVDALREVLSNKTVLVSFCLCK